eukprot:gene6478-13079_t
MKETYDGIIGALRSEVTETTAAKCRTEWRLQELGVEMDSVCARNKLMENQIHSQQTELQGLCMGLLGCLGESAITRLRESGVLQNHSQTHTQIETQTQTEIENQILRDDMSKDVREDMMGVSMSMRALRSEVTETTAAKCRTECEMEQLRHDIAQLKLDLESSVVARVSVESDKEVMRRECDGVAGRLQELGVEMDSEELLKRQRNHPVRVLQEKIRELEEENTRLRQRISNVFWK